ncbi:hypothetical protein BBP40_003140 [Aspergillus hancockii]|nr:hypothetical protein BBP40_003140 [Aspergillus hancockii]
MQQLILQSQVKEFGYYGPSQIYEIQSNDARPVHNNKVQKAWKVLIDRYAALTSVSVSGASQEGLFNQVILKLAKANIRIISDVGSSKIQMASAQPEESLRPETDYERWLLEQDEHYRPGDHPVYGPDMQGLDDPIANGKGRDRFNEGIGLKNYSMICSIILSVLLMIAIIKTAKSFRKKRQQGGIPLSGKAWDKMKDGA